MSKHEFHSQGFDLDAIPSSYDDEGGDEVVYEIGGGASTVNSKLNHTPTTNSSNMNDLKEVEKDNNSHSPISKSEELKNEGNKYFKEGNYLDAYDFYTDAIEACPGMTGTEIMELKLKHDEQEREKTYRRNSREAERLRKRDDTSIKPSKSNNGDVNTHQEGDDEDINDKPCEFKIPPHEYGDKLSVYYCNRAACSINLERYQEAISDCDLSLILNPAYTKAFIRRMTAYEKTEQVDKALVDAKAAQQLDSKNVDIKRHVQRLQKLEDARMEKLKAETMGKLKELGNSILGNFGMSLDNFKAVQDPNTGSYSISYQNN